MDYYLRFRILTLFIAVSLQLSIRTFRFHFSLLRVFYHLHLPLKVLQTAIHSIRSVLYNSYHTCVIYLIHMCDNVRLPFAPNPFDLVYFRYFFHSFKFVRHAHVFPVLILWFMQFFSVILLPGWFAFNAFRFQLIDELSNEMMRIL